MKRTLDVSVVKSDLKAAMDALDHGNSADAEELARAAYDALRRFHGKLPMPIVSEPALTEDDLLSFDALRLGEVR